MLQGSSRKVSLCIHTMPTWVPCTGCCRDRAGISAPTVLPSVPGDIPAAGGRAAAMPAPGPWALSPWLPAHPLHIPHRGSQSCCMDEQELIARLPRQCRGWWREDALGQTSHRNLLPVAGWQWQLRQEPESAWPNSHNKHGEGGRLQPMKKLWRDRKRTA